LMSGAMSDALGFGGYPQNVATALLPLSLVAAQRYLAGGEARWAVATAAMLVAVAGTHHALFVVGLAMHGALGAAWASTAPGWPMLWRRGWVLALCAAAGIAAFLPVYLRLQQLG